MTGTVEQFEACMRAARKRSGEDLNIPADAYVFYRENKGYDWGWSVPKGAEVIARFFQGEEMPLREVAP
jgi:hypothetical protein